MTIRSVRENAVDEPWYRDLAGVTNAIIQGRTNNTGSLTLTANTATSTVTEAPLRLSTNSVILLSPKTANAATEFGSGNLYVSNIDVNAKTFTITHTNAATTDRDFDYAIIG